MLFCDTMLAEFKIGLLSDVQNVIADKKIGVHSSLLVSYINTFSFLNKYINVKI